MSGQAVVDNVVGASALLILLVGPLYAALVIARRLYGDGQVAARWAAAALLWLVQLVLCVSVLGHLGVMRRGTAIVLCALIATVAFWGRGTGPVWRREAESLRAYIRTHCRGWTGVFFGAALLVVIWAATRAVLMPPLGHDSLTYHYYFAARWVQEGRLISFSDLAGMDGYSHFPVNGEYLAAWLLLPLSHELLLNLSNFFGWTLAAIALYALGRELQLRRPLALLLAASVVFSPMVFAYLTSGYVAILVLGALSAAGLFFLRFARSGGVADGALTLASLGLGIGTKHTALITCAVLGALTVAYALLWARRGKARSALIAIVAGGLLAAAVGLPQYVKNCWHTGNPLYPLGVKVAGRTIFTAADSSRRAAEGVGPGTRADDWASLHQLFSYRPVRASLPWRGPVRSAGPKFALLIVIALVGLAVSFRVKGLRRLHLTWLVVAGLMPLLAFYLDDSTTVLAGRRHWIMDTPRFLSGPLALLAACAFVFLDRLARGRTFGILALSGLVVLDLVHVNHSLLRPLENAAFWAASSLALVATGAMFFRGWPRRPWLRVAAVVGAVVWVAGAVGYLRDYRGRNRHLYYQSYVDLHALPRHSVAGWNWLDRLKTPQTIAFTTGWQSPGHNWFYYPLMGQALQHKAVYASVSRRGNPLTHVDGGEASGRKDRDIWLANLREIGVNLIFVQAPWPTELRWMMADRATFPPVFAGRHFVIARFDPARLGAYRRPHRGANSGL